MEKYENLTNEFFNGSKNNFNKWFENVDKSEMCEYFIYLQKELNKSEILEILKYIK